MSSVTARASPHSSPPNESQRRPCFRLAAGDILQVSEVRAETSGTPSTSRVGSAGSDSHACQGEHAWPAGFTATRGLRASGSSHRVWCRRSSARRSCRRPRRRSEEVWRTIRRRSIPCGFRSRRRSTPSSVTRTGRLPWARRSSGMSPSEAICRPPARPVMGMPESIPGPSTRSTPGSTAPSTEALVPAARRTPTSFRRPRSRIRRRASAASSAASTTSLP
ncbi:MAG: hypothetical protein RJA16_671 [Planctomycetota bacterium]